MAHEMTEQQRRVLTVLSRMREQVQKDPDAAEMFSEGLDSLLQELADNDCFGTEGQLDPRGDGRDGEWSLWCVQGVDDIAGGEDLDLADDTQG